METISFNKSEYGIHDRLAEPYMDLVGTNMRQRIRMAANYFNKVR